MPHINARLLWVLSIALALSSFSFAQQTPSPAPTPAPVKTIATAEELAVALVAVKTEQERDALLAAHKELQTAELRKALVAQGDRFRASRGNPSQLAGNYERALNTYRLAQAIAEQMGDQNSVAEVLQRIAATHFTQRKYDLALEAHQKALTLYEAFGDKRGMAYALFYIGEAHGWLGREDLALEYYQKVVALRGALGSEARDQTILGHATKAMGHVYHRQGKYDLMFEQLQKGAALYEAAGNKREMAELLGQIGNIQRELGRDDLALVSYRQALALFEALGRREDASFALGHIAESYMSQGNFAQALEYRLKILAADEAAGCKRCLVYSLSGVGAFHLGLGNYDLGMEYYQRALREASEYEGTDKRLLMGLMLSTIGRVQARHGKYDAALEHYQKALTIFNELNDGRLSALLADMGDAHFERRDYDLAMEYYQQALTQSAKARVGFLSVSVLNSMGQIHLLRGNYAQALEAASRSTDVFSKSVARDNRFSEFWQTRTIAGRAYRALNRATEARQAFDEAIAAIEDLRGRVAGGGQARQRFFENKVSPYYAAVGLLVEQNKPDEALAYAERAKARVLLDVLQSGRVNVTKAMTAQEREQEQTLRNELVSLNTQFSGERQRERPDENRLADLDARLQRTRREHEGFQQSLYAAHPELKVQRGEAQPVTLEEAATLLPDTKSALLEYVVSDDKTYLFVLTKSSEREQSKVDLKTYAVEIKRNELTERTQAFRQQLAKRDLVFRDSASAFYNLLLKPARAQLQDKTSLVIVPDGVLWELPFQALQPAGNRYLLEDYAISYAPSLTVLREMSKLRGKETSSKTAVPTLFAVGNPALRTETVARVKFVLRDGKLDPLPEAEKEVKALKQLYGTAQSTVYIGAEAREDRVKAEAGKFRILHLATHGILNDRSPMYSQLLLSQTAGNASEDGLLEAWEIMKMDLHADLVVLSACETARGRFTAGEGMIGLTWALFVAGSPTTVVSQWKVGSTSTAQLMLEFHRNLSNGFRNSKRPVGAAVALREASLKLLRNKDTQHPFYWAGFVVVGDGR